MLYYTNKARQTAREGIADEIAKLASLKPTDQFTLQDIQNTISCLRNMDDALRREIKMESMRGHS